MVTLPPKRLWHKRLWPHASLTNFCALLHVFFLESGAGGCFTTLWLLMLHEPGQEMIALQFGDRGGELTSGAVGLCLLTAYVTARLLGRGTGNCAYPSASVPAGECRHHFHIHCIMKWLQKEQKQYETQPQPCVTAGYGQ